MKSRPTVAGSGTTVMPRPARIAAACGLAAIDVIAQPAAAQFAGERGRPQPGIHAVHVPVVVPVALGPDERRAGRRSARR